MVEQMKAEFVQRISRIGKHWDLGGPAGKVFGSLLFNGTPLTQKEIARDCNYSLGLVSTSVRHLLEVGIIETDGKRNKEKLYRIRITTTDFFGVIISEFIDQDIRPIIEFLDMNTDGIRNEEVRKNIEYLKEDFMITESLSRLFSSILLARKSIPKEEMDEILAGLESQLNIRIDEYGKNKFT